MRKMTDQQFINASKKVQIDQYVYYLVNYKNNRTKVDIICPIHGIFSQLPKSHLKGHGCPKCAGFHRTIKDIIELFTKAHPNENYNYEKSVFSGMRNPLIIICQFHGEFLQAPLNHLNKQGCPTCGREGSIIHKTKTNEEFIEESKIIHNDSYIYTDTKYKNDHEKVIIICHIHGKFEQTPNLHLRGQGCPDCSKIKRRQKASKEGRKQFILEGNKIHSGKYGYSKSIFINSHTPLIIMCPIHGEFLQTPVSHIHQQSGCGKCSGHYNKTNEDFIREGNEVHKNNYDYSKTNYKNSQIKVIIACPIHGEFLQLPSSHLQGIGCPSCNKSHGNKLIEHYLESKEMKSNPEHTFLDCINPETGKCYRFDNFSKTLINNIPILIEFDGEQHFKIDPYLFWHNKNIENATIAFEDQQKSDFNKTEYAILSKIPLLRIHYKYRKTSETFCNLLDSFIEAVENGTWIQPKHGIYLHINKKI